MACVRRAPCGEGHTDGTSKGDRLFVRHAGGGPARGIGSSPTCCIAVKGFGILELKGI
jgi:hypothetical protein